MDEDYFVTRPPVDPHAPVVRPTPESLERLDLAGLLHEPLVEPRWARLLRGSGYLLAALGVLVLASLPFLAIKALASFFDSLPW